MVPYVNAFSEKIFRTACNGLEVSTNKQIMLILSILMVPNV